MNSIAWAALWFVLGLITGWGFAAWIQSAREYHEKRTDQIKDDFE